VTYQISQVSVKHTNHNEIEKSFVNLILF